MCGIAGFLNLTTSDGPGAMRTQVERMAAAVCHRGPDGAGTWVDPGAGIALGHRRLAVLDLSPAGDQPMVSASGRYVIAYNGEIYNAQELRADLESTDTTGPVFRGRSDTEVLLAALERWGLPGGVRRLNGMFAFALWDREERILYLVRDRLGEKPLYYGWNGRCFLFGSELKALRAYPGFHDEIDRTAVALLLRHGYIPAPYSIHEGISKLPPAAILSLRALNGRCDPEINAYWSAKAVAERGCSNPLRVSGPEAVEQLDRLVREAVRIRMVADVPVGAMLSGGIDSSAVVALMQAQSSRPVRTFSIGFHEDAYNEAGHARHVAGYLGCRHTEVYVTAADALAIVPRLPAVYDEPFADSSQIPSFLLSSLVRGSVTVSLSGDGGDELFGGYPRYLWASRIWNACRWMPRGSRRLLSEALTGMPPRSLERGLNAVRPFLPSVALRHPVDKLRKVAGLLSSSRPEGLYLEFVSHWKDAAAVVAGAREAPTWPFAPEHCPNLRKFADTMMFLDTVSYLPDDLLTKIDRATMAVSLESRAPLLDHRLVEFAWRLPHSMKIRHGRGKWILRQLLRRYLPETLLDRPKIGFAIPLEEWLRGPLRGWAEELLSEARLRRDAYLDPAPVRQKWREHLSGKHNCCHALWSVLMFQAWLAYERGEGTGRVKSGHCRAMS